MQNHIAVFKGKRIRKAMHNGEWWFAVNDVIQSLTDSNDPAQYFKRLKQRDKELAKLIDKGGVQFVPPLMLEVETQGGKQKMYCWNTEGIFRLVQAIPSPKATFGVTPGEYKELKGLKRENLRDHMDDLELIFTVRGCKIKRAKDSQLPMRLLAEALA
jgi:hypothetical protein